MLFNESTFIGIDPTAGKRRMAYAALDSDLRVLALEKGDLDEITAFVGGQQAAITAINSPRRPNQGLMKREDIREKLKPIPRPGRWTGYRVAEYLLRQHNIHIMRTCSEAKDCPNWMQIGFDLYKRLESMGYRDYPSPEASYQMLEVYPHAAYTALLKRTPFKKTTLEGRLQRQLLLHNKGLDIPDPMRFFEEITRYKIMQGVLPLEGLYSVRSLEALVAAYTAWMALTSRDEITIIGHPEEGQIVLPIPELKPKY
jgi:hypothetical protein